MSQASEHQTTPHFYTQEGEFFVPTGLSRSPWDRQAIAGGPICALFAHVAQDAALDDVFTIARFSVDIFGKVPYQPLGTVTEVLRDGRQTKLHRIQLTADGRPVAQVHVLRVRKLETPIAEAPSPYPGPDDVTPAQPHSGIGMQGALGLRLVSGAPGTPGRGVAWLSMSAEIVAGHPSSNLEKAAMFADYGNGFGNATDAREWSYANLDVTIQFLRLPVGDWFLLDAETHMAGDGHGTVSNIFADEQGVYARGFQTIFVAPGNLSAQVPGRYGKENS